MPHFITLKSKISKSFHKTLSNSTSEHRAEMGRGPEAPALEGSQSQGADTVGPTTDAKTLKPSQQEPPSRTGTRRLREGFSQEGPGLHPER